MEYVIEVFLMRADGELHFQAKTGATIDEGKVVGGTVIGGGNVTFI